MADCGLHFRSNSFCTPAGPANRTLGVEILIEIDFQSRLKVSSKDRNFRSGLNLFDREPSGAVFCLRSSCLLAVPLGAESAQSPIVSRKSFDFKPKSPRKTACKQKSSHFEPKKLPKQRSSGRFQLQLKIVASFITGSPENKQQSETGRILFWRVWFQTRPSPSAGERAQRVPLSLLLSAKANSPSVWQNSPRLPENSVRLSEFSSLKQYSRNSTLPIS